MSETRDWSFPEESQPTQAQFDFDLERALDAVVALRAEIPDDAFTAGVLGTDRGGNGVVISDDGVVLTIGYLITEASRVWLTTRRGQVIEAFPLAYDQVTGFGLVRALGRLQAASLPMGRAAATEVGAQVLMVGAGGVRHSLVTQLTDRREFAGYWEYLLDEALFTSPAHPEWSGAALLNAGGELIGLGSLLAQESIAGKTQNANMSVPVDLLTPIYQNLLSTGHSGLPSRPWMGLYAGENEGKVVVGGLSTGGPSENAGLRPLDLIVGVDGKRVTTLAEFLRAVWATGEAGVKVPLMIGREGDLLRIEVQTIDRASLLRRPRMH